MNEIGRWLLITGVIIAAIGAILMFSGFGKLPGDIVWRKGNFTFFGPFGTMLVISIILTIVLNVIARFFK